MGKIAIVIGCTALIWTILDNAIALGLPWVFTAEELTCCCNNGCADTGSEGECNSLPGCEWKFDDVRQVDTCEEKHYNSERDCNGAGRCSNSKFDDNAVGCAAAGECSTWTVQNSSSMALTWLQNTDLSTQASCLAEGTCNGLNLGSAPWLCVDDRSGALSAAGTSCQSVLAVAAMLNLGATTVALTRFQCQICNTDSVALPVMAIQVAARQTFTP
eukprot:COSAG05_NODE_394_length_10383_cov_2.581389_2_plen_216_part_00